jgi:hypothetical protein
VGGAASSNGIRARVLAASVASAVRIALEDWLQPADGSRNIGGLVVVSDSLPSLLRAALAPLAPAFDAVDTVDIVDAITSGGAAVARDF